MMRQTRIIPIHRLSLAFGCAAGVVLWCVSLVYAPVGLAAPVRRPVSWPANVHALSLRCHRMSGDIHVSFKQSTAIVATDATGRPWPPFRRAADGWWSLSSKSWLRGGETLYLTLPLGSRLDLRTLSGDVHIGPGAGRSRIQTLSGLISARRCIGAIEAKTVSGNISLRRCQDAFVKSVSGRVTLSYMTGNVQVSSVSGVLRLREMHGRWLQASTVSGDVFLHNVRVQQATLSSFSGDLDLKGALRPGAFLSLSSKQGDLSFSRPSAQTVKLHLTSLSGSRMVGKQILPTTQKTYWLRAASARAATTIVRLNTLSGDIQVRP